MYLYIFEDNKDIKARNDRWFFLPKMWNLILGTNTLKKWKIGSWETENKVEKMFTPGDHG